MFRPLSSSAALGPIRSKSLTNLGRGLVYEAPSAAQIRAALVAGPWITTTPTKKVVNGDQDGFFSPLAPHIVDPYDEHKMRKAKVSDRALGYTQIAEQIELPENLAGRHAWTPTHKGKSYVVRGTICHDLRSQTLKNDKPPLVTTMTAAPRDTARSTAR